MQNLTGEERGWERWVENIIWPYLFWWIKHLPSKISFSCHWLSPCSSWWGTNQPMRLKKLLDMYSTHLSFYTSRTFFISGQPRSIPLPSAILRIPNKLKRRGWDEKVSVLSRGWRKTDINPTLCLNLHESLTYPFITSKALSLLFILFNIPKIDFSLITSSFSINPFYLLKNVFYSYLPFHHFDNLNHPSYPLRAF